MDHPEVPMDNNYPENRADHVPATVPYLFADAALVEHWQKELRETRDEVAKVAKDAILGK